MISTQVGALLARHESRDSLRFETRCPPELIESGSIAFRDYQFRRYGRRVLLCSAAGVLGLALLVRAGVSTSLILFPATLVFLGPVWVLYKFYIGPRTLAARLRRLLAPAGHMEVSPGSITLPVHGGQSLALGWSEVDVVLETHDVFVIVLSPVSAYCVAKPGMPTAIAEVFRRRTHS